MLVDKQTRNALDRIMSCQPDRPRKSYTYQYLCEILDLDEDDMFPIIKNLVDKGLAEYAYVVGRQGRRDIGIALKQDGLKHKELCRLERIQRWKERVCGFSSGVALTVVATVILQQLGL